MSRIWSVRRKNTAGGKCFAIDTASSPLSYRQVVALWQHNAEFRDLFTSILCAVQYRAYRWETPPISTSTISRAFEFVVLNAPELERPQNPQAFERYFQQHREKSTVTFENLGKDALLMAPCRTDRQTDYCHLGSFLRTAPEAQKHDLWQTVGQTLANSIDATPRWLSTAGHGVAWLHIRLDDRPKYYSYKKYRDE